MKLSIDNHLECALSSKCEKFIGVEFLIEKRKNEKYKFRDNSLTIDIVKQFQWKWIEQKKLKGRKSESIQSANNFFSLSLFIAFPTFIEKKSSIFNTTFFLNPKAIPSLLSTRQNKSIKTRKGKSRDYGDF